MRLKNSDAAIEVSKRGATAATRFGSGHYFGVDHLLWGLVSDGDVANVLSGCGVTRDAVLQMMSVRNGVQPARAMDDEEALATLGIEVSEVRQAAAGLGLGSLTLTQPATLTYAHVALLWLAQMQAERLGSSEVHPAHVLLAMAWHDPSTLRASGLRSIVELRRRLLEHLEVSTELAGLFERQWDHSNEAMRTRAAASRADYDLAWVADDALPEHIARLLREGGTCALRSVAHLHTLRAEAELAGFDVIDNAGETATAFWMSAHTGARQIHVASAASGSDPEVSVVGYHDLSLIPSWLTDDPATYSPPSLPGE
jgi:hypothetical protein